LTSTSSLRLATKRSLQDSYLAAADTACASFSNESIRLEPERDDKKRIKVNVHTPLLALLSNGNTLRAQ
jgi:hypothetical protein